MRKNIQDLFKDLQVLELASVLAGPLAGSFLAELGAKVIKIENKRTEGDITRKWHLASENKEELSAYFQSANYNKESVYLDFEREEDIIQLRELIQSSDIILSNFQKRTQEKFDLSPEQMKSLNPSSIIVQLDAYDNSKAKPGYDVVMQAETGYLHMTGEEGSNPIKMPVAMVDILAGHQIKEAILLGLMKRMDGGGGSVIRVSLFQSGISALANQAGNYLIAGHIPEKMGTTHPNIAPYGDRYETADKKQLVLAVGTDRQFKKLCVFLRIEKERMDKFASNQFRVSQREELNNLIRAEIANYDSKTLESQFNNLGIPFGFIKKMDEVFDDPLSQQMLLTNTWGNKIVGQIAFHFSTE